MKVAPSCSTLCNPMDHQAPLSMGLPGQEYWSGLPSCSPGDLHDPGIEPRSPALEADSLPEPPGKPPNISESMSKLWGCDCSVVVKWVNDYWT